MAQHKQMAITQFKHKYQQIHLEHTQKIEHHTPSSVIQIFTHLIISHNKNYQILGRGKSKQKNGTFGFACRNFNRRWQLKWGTEKRYPRFCFPELQSKTTVEMRDWDDSWNEGLRRQLKWGTELRERECRSEGEWGSVGLSWGRGSIRLREGG